MDAITITVRRLSELPRVLIVITIGLRSQRRLHRVSLCSFCRIFNDKRPVAKSHTMNRIFPKWNQTVSGCQAVGTSSQLSSGVYL